MAYTVMAYILMAYIVIALSTQGWNRLGTCVCACACAFVRVDVGWGKSALLKPGRHVVMVYTVMEPGLWP